MRDGTEAARGAVRLDASFDDIEWVDNDRGDGGGDGGGVEARMERMLTRVASRRLARGVHDTFARVV